MRDRRAGDRQRQAQQPDESERAVAVAAFRFVQAPANDRLKSVVAQPRQQTCGGQNHAVVPEFGHPCWLWICRLSSSKTRHCRSVLARAASSSRKPLVQGRKSCPPLSGDQGAAGPHLSQGPRNSASEQWESSSLSALEAAACQRPLFLNDLPWARDAFKDRATCCRPPPNCCGALRVSPEPPAAPEAHVVAGGWPAGQNCL